MAVAAATWYHCNVKVISRSRPPRTAVGAAAYITGTRIYDKELEALPGYEPSDYRRRGGVEHWFIHAPENVPDWTYDVASLANAAQARDTRKNSCTARTGKLALPDSTDAQGREEIAHQFSDYLVERYGVAVITAIHEPDRDGDDRNWHMHFWFTTREMDENGLGAKTRVLDEKATGSGEIEHIREAAADIINRHLEARGIDERVDHRSYEDRGIERIPTEHMGAAAAMERRGERTERGDRNREIRESNQRIEQLESELAEIRAEIQAEIAWEQVSTLEEPEQDFSFPTVPSSELEPPLSWDEQKRQAQSPFTSEVTARMDNDIGEGGQSIFDIPPAPAWIKQVTEPAEAQETGWYDYTVITFNLIYRRAYDAARVAMDAARAIKDKGVDYLDSWQQRYFMEKDRELDRESDIDFDR
jgi:MobA/MobL family